MSISEITIPVVPIKPETAIARIQAGEKIVASYMGWSAAAGFIPVPLLDLGAISLVQLKMIEEISKLYPKVNFRKSAAKDIIAALAAGTGTVLLAAPAASVIKILPGVGSIIGALAEPALASAFTYALGRIFIQHFEGGGSLFDLNPEEYRKQIDAAMAAAAASSSSSAAQSSSPSSPAAPHKA